MGTWITLWTVLWFGGLIIFSYLAVVVVYQGFRDLRELFRTIERQHEGAGAETGE